MNIIFQLETSDLPGHPGRTGDDSRNVPADVKTRFLGMARPQNDRRKARAFRPMQKQSHGMKSLKEVEASVDVGLDMFGCWIFTFKMFFSSAL